MVTVPNFTSFLTPKEKHFPVGMISFFPPWRMLIIVSPSMLVSVGSPNSGFTFADLVSSILPIYLSSQRRLSPSRSRGTFRKIFRKMFGKSRRRRLALVGWGNVRRFCGLWFLNINEGKFWGDFGGFWEIFVKNFAKSFAKSFRNLCEIFAKFLRKFRHENFSTLEFWGNVPEPVLAYYLYVVFH